MVKWGTDVDKWQFTGLYGFLWKENKVKTYDLLFDLKQHSTLP